jgi:hypothetical protein
MFLGTGLVCLHHSDTYASVVEFRWDGATDVEGAAEQNTVCVTDTEIQSTKYERVKIMEQNAIINNEREKKEKHEND